MKKVCRKGGLCCARMLTAALAALAPLSMNIQSDALPTYALPHIAWDSHPGSFTSLQSLSSNIRQLFNTKF